MPPRASLFPNPTLHGSLVALSQHHSSLSIRQIAMVSAAAAPDHVLCRLPSPSRRAPTPGDRRCQTHTPGLATAQLNLDTCVTAVQLVLRLQFGAAQLNLSLQLTADQLDDRKKLVEGMPSPLQHYMIVFVPGNHNHARVKLFLVRTYKKCCHLLYCFLRLFT